MIPVSLLQGDYLIHVCRDGTLTCRHKAEPVFNGRALPCYSTATREEAVTLIAAVGALQYTEHPLLPGQSWYVFPGFGGELENITDVSIRLREVETLMELQK